MILTAALRALRTFVVRLLAAGMILTGALHREKRRRAMLLARMVRPPSPVVVVPSSPATPMPPQPVVDPTDPLSVAAAKQRELTYRTRRLEELELEAYRR